MRMLTRIFLSRFFYPVLYKWVVTPINGPVGSFPNPPLAYTFPAREKQKGAPPVFLYSSFIFMFYFQPVFHHPPNLPPRFIFRTRDRLSALPAASLRTL